MGWPSTLGSSLVSRPIEKDAARLWRFVCDHAEIFLIALGIFIRLEVYARDRRFGLDEKSLWGNIERMPVLDFSQPLRGDQLAPLGFLIALRALVWALGATQFVGRSISLASGIATLFLFCGLARRILPRPAALIALTLFVCSEDLIYYSSEMKPYSLDVAVGLALTLAAIDAQGKPMSPRRAAGMAVGALVAPWFSFPSVFIVAAGGLVLILTRILARDFRAAVLWAAIGVAWLLSFLAAYAVSLRLLSPTTSMYYFWDFAFLPILPVPMSMLRVYETVGILLEIFVNPLNMVAPSWIGVALPILFLSIGALSLARRAWPAWAILVVPIALAMVASALKRYPLHGRLILELVPAFHLLVAEGAALLVSQTAGRSKLACHAVLAVVLAQPCLAGLYLIVDEPSRNHNQHGDLHKNLFLIEDDTPRMNPTAPLPGQRTGRRSAPR
jgi:hypothetical protein